MSHSPHTQGFASILYIIFVHEKAARVESVAPMLDIRPSTFYEYIRGYKIFPPDLIAPLYNAIKDDRILTFILNPCGVVHFEAPKEEVCDIGVLEQLIASNREFMDLQVSILNAIKDGKVTRREIEMAEAEMMQSFNASAKLVNALKQLRSQK